MSRSLGVTLVETPTGGPTGPPADWRQRLQPSELLRHLIELSMLLWLLLLLWLALWRQDQLWLLAELKQSRLCLRGAETHTCSRGRKYLFEILCKPGDASKGMSLHWCTFQILQTCKDEHLDRLRATDHELVDRSN